MANETFTTPDEKTSIIKRFSVINQAWLVWREDRGHQALVRIHNSEEEADADFNERVVFLQLIYGVAQ